MIRCEGIRTDLMVTDDRDLYYVVSHKIGEAIGDYTMIAEGDKILIALSGGKDSLALLEFLRYRQRFAPVKYELYAGFVDMGIPGFPRSELEEYLRGTGIPLFVEHADIVQGGRWEDVNCYHCAQLRRKTLFQMADRIGCRKIAFGHHLDDIVETILMNMFYRAEIGAMCPRQEMFKGLITIIRPLAYVQERDIRALVAQGRIKDLAGHQCPNDQRSKRVFLKHILAQLEADHHVVKRNILKSLKQIKHDYLP